MELSRILFEDINEDGHDISSGRMRMLMRGKMWRALGIVVGLMGGIGAEAPLLAWQASPSSNQPPSQPKFQVAPEVKAFIDESKTAGVAYKWDDALRAAEKGRAKAQELNDKYSEAAALNRIGNIHYLSGDLRKA